MMLLISFMFKVFGWTQLVANVTLCA